VGGLGHFLCRGTRRPFLPVVLGHGKRLFADPGGKAPLKLTDSAALETGVLNLADPRA
jgi:hypothetical protein